MKKVLMFFLLIAFFISAHAQHQKMFTEEWKILALRNGIKPVNGKNIFPAKLMELNGQVIDLPGFIIPIKIGNRFETFMISMVPMLSCPYCGTGDIPPMVEVHLEGSTVSADADIICVRGKLVINNSGNGKSEFILTDAKLID